MDPSPSLHPVVSQPNPPNRVIILPFVTYDLVCVPYWPTDEVVEAWTPSGNEEPRIDGLLDVNQPVCVCALCVCMCMPQWIQTDVLVPAMRWQQEDEWGNKKLWRLMLMWPHSCTYTHPPCPKAKQRDTAPIIQQSAGRHISSGCCGGISCVWGLHTGQEAAERPASVYCCVQIHFILLPANPKGLIYDTEEKPYK